ncbi:plastocyanin [Salinadaptatus halalkaliphilus]|uniref:Plastocyanin n=1 Tax=Salinadaptatus halalkaliphilus TaxID=2419781 RepID=A0A4S3TPN2_9EURY|nr:PQQ-dependent sugar dehydrogenase [Salinadaptatus halalkaliphilus]THE65650.1 plastocyanin [Salinadaptatus halalkaliphilus]
MTLPPTSHDTRDGPARRTVLQALAASGALAGVGTIGTAQEDDQTDDGLPAELEDIPVAGEFPEGETVGLQPIATNLPGPTDFEYATVGDEVYHFIATQTGQIYQTNVHEQVDDLDGDNEDEPEATDADEDDLETDNELEDDLDDESPADETPDDAEPEEFVFNGVIPAWFGMEPEAIDGAENPTLELTAGETYRFTWENGDGQPHNVVILDAADNIIERTEIVREAGETQTLEFEATEEMDSYVCEVHPGTMVGRIQVEDPEEEPPEEPAVSDAQTPADMDLVLDIQDQIVPLGIGELGGYDERGLLGLTFHPDFEDNGLFYVRYSAPERDGLGYDHTDVLAEFQVGEELPVDPETERTIMEIPQPQDNHNGGRLAFGPDGYLYTSVGDGGNVHDIGIGHVEDWYDENEGGNGQDTRENLLGGIHRIDVDGDEDQPSGEYAIPDDNPLVDSEADRHEYWAWGFRNPWGMSIDDDGQVYVSDAGQHVVESIYEVEAGGNYSWNVKEGSFCFSPETPLEPPAECPDEVGEGAGDLREGELLRDPIAEYQHTRISTAFIDSSVVVGGHRYVGDAIPELEGAFVFGNWSSQGVAEADGEVLAAIEPGDGDTDDLEDNGETDDDEPANTDLVEVDERWGLEELLFEGADDESINRYVYSIERDEEGELYVLANTDFRPDPETGEIYKIVPADEGVEIPAPADPFVVDEEMAGEEPDADVPAEDDTDPDAPAEDDAVEDEPPADDPEDEPPADDPEDEPTADQEMNDEPVDEEA